MTRRWKPPRDLDAQQTPAPDQEDFPIEDDRGRDVLGLPTGEDAPLLYDARTGEVFRSELEEGVVRPREDHDWELDPEETVGDLLERIGDEVGWESMSEFAEEHLEDED